MPDKQMFGTDTRYITRGISEQVPLELQLFMWGEIDRLARTTDTLDYLQVFELRVKENHLELEHRQEVPDYKKTHKLKLLEGYRTLDKMKIFVIDSMTEYSTMLLAIEY